MGGENCLCCVDSEKLVIFVCLVLMVDCKDNLNVF